MSESPIQQVNWKRIFWQTPLVSYIKLNVDASIFETYERSGCGGVFRNDKGDWLLGFECKSFSLLVISVELHALAIGLRLAWDHGYRQLLMESNRLQAVMCISNSIEEVWPEVSPLVYKIKDLVHISWQV